MSEKLTTTRKTCKPAESAVSRFCFSAVQVVIVVTFGLLCLASFLVTAVSPSYTEKIEYRLFHFLPMVICALIAFATLYLLYSSRFFRSLRLKDVCWALFTYMTLAGILWAVLADTWPWFDSLDLIHCAKDLGASNDYWQVGCYMNRFPFQVGYLCLIKLVMIIFGESQTYLVLEIVNAVAAGVASVYIVRLTDIYFDEESAKLGGLTLFLFLPFIYYSTFAYGNIPCLPFTIAALYYQARAIKTDSLFSSALSAACIAIGALLKSTAKIVLIAMILIMVLSALREKKARSLFGAAVIVLGFFCVTQVFYALVVAKYGVDMSNGVPGVAWLAMGLDVTNKNAINSNNPGWYSGFVWALPGDTYSPQVIHDQAIESIKSSLATFVGDPAFALSFFSRKIASIWLEPTYTGLVNGNWSVGGDVPMATRPMTRVLASAYYGKANTLILTLSDFMQTLTLASTVYYIVQNGSKRDVPSLCPAIAAFGFFLVYLVWEGKAQYSLIPYVLMLAYVGYFIKGLLVALDGRWHVAADSCEIKEEA